MFFRKLQVVTKGGSKVFCGFLWLIMRILTGLSAKNKLNKNKNFLNLGKKLLTFAFMVDNIFFGRLGLGASRLCNQTCVFFSHLGGVLSVGEKSVKFRIAFCDYFSGFVTRNYYLNLFGGLGNV
jgi:hypothetical protein